MAHLATTQRDQTKKLRQSQYMTALILLLITSVSSAITPKKANFILGMQIEGQRLNLHQDCPEGSVTCDNLLLVAPDVGLILQTAMLGERQYRAPYPVKTYPARTKHSLCRDNITPCKFQGYRFEGEDFNGFINPSDKTIHIASNWTTDADTFSYQENPVYFPLTSQSKYIDRLYQASDKALNEGYQQTYQEVKTLFGRQSAQDFKQEQRDWIVERSKHCGADTAHLPRSQAEKVCFIQKNQARSEAYFLWID